jgi:hypothetical protein
MLAEFQQALADLTASPAFSSSARENPSLLRDRYELSDREFDRLVGILRHPGMECACIVYRANRLAPLAMNVPQTCKALGPELRAVVEEFWAAYPETNVHFFVETDRFCRFLQEKITYGAVFPPGVVDALARESQTITVVLAESHTESDSYNASLSVRNPSAHGAH